YGLNRGRNAVLARIIHEPSNRAAGTRFERHFPAREKQDVFPAAYREVFTAAREMPFEARRRA
ncbi:MAG: hypothetical protein KGJ72_11370, partial [Gammaproteobacteria bacterium]|nr:hypothetical protein [Gammaproteobacteria bacterium]